MDLTLGLQNPLNASAQRTTVSPLQLELSSNADVLDADVRGELLKE
jgi:hypothetical protein